MALNDQKIPLFEMLVGVAGSGKSTYALQRKIFLSEMMGLQSEIVSSDDLREEVWGDASDQRDPGYIFSIMVKRTREYLSKGICVIFDACNVQEKWRRQTLDRIKDIKCHRECIVFIERPEVCIARQKMRSRFVPEHIIWRQIKQFQMPNEYEGWDLIDVHANSYLMNEIIEVINPLKEFDQKNPHHTCTLDEHMVKAADYANAHSFSYHVNRAALIHDVGKLFTQSFDEKGVAHYYGHENVSAYYWFLLTGDIWWDGKQIAWLINHHMDFFKGQSYMDKLKKKLNNEELFEELEQLHECDLAAH